MSDIGRKVINLKTAQALELAMPETCREVRDLDAVGGKADVARTYQNDANDPKRTFAAEDCVGTLDAVCEHIAH